MDFSARWQALKTMGKYFPDKQWAYKQIKEGILRFPLKSATDGILLAKFADMWMKDDKCLPSS